MSTTTTNFGFIKPELSDMTDITTPNANWDVLDVELMKINNKSSKSVVIEDRLLTTKWGNNVYTWSNSNIKSANQIIELLPSPSITVEQLEALQIANIVGTSQQVGSVTFTAYGEIPIIDIPVVFIVRGDV